jgi:hypothetical protein
LAQSFRWISAADDSAQDDSVFHRVRIVTRSPAGHVKPVGSVQRLRGEIRFAHLQEYSPNALRLRSPERKAQQPLSDPAAALSGFHHQIQDLHFIGGRTKQDESD